MSKEYNMLLQAAGLTAKGMDWALVIPHSISVTLYGPIKQIGSISLTNEKAKPRSDRLYYYSLAASNLQLLAASRQG